MGVLKKLEVRNFKCFRDWVGIELAQATYLAGANNSGKTALLAALAGFLDSDYFLPEYINKTELTGKKEGFNRSDSRVTFDLQMVTGEVRRKRLMETYGNAVAITKSFTWREASATLSITYRVGAAVESQQVEELDKDIQHLLNSVAVSYIHPQEGIELLRRAQEKFKRRLFHNWGRHASVAASVNDVQEKWTALRGTANSYLSSALSTKLREIWPNAEVQVDLPERIQEIVAVSDITFRSSPNLPQVTLPSHGTGAQSAILYQTHYLLDSDRTLHQGMYFPVWLLEEPESFLHADIALQLARLLSSPEWLGSIQMLISTHSPIILAGSRQQPESCGWVILENHAIKWSKPVSTVTPSDVADVGKLMGDANFAVYFDASSSSPRVFLEDSRGRTQEKFEACGIDVTGTLGGVTQVKKYIDVLLAMGRTLSGETYFIVDSDRGLKELSNHLADASLIETVNGWKKYELAAGVFIVALPGGYSVETLFKEWDDVVGECLDDLCDAGLKLRPTTPTDLSRAASELRSKPPTDRDAAIDVLRRHGDVKDRFWLRSDAWSFLPEHADALVQLVPTRAS